ncbi:MAG: ABC transporter ATP-binding protein [Halioglobus sp.]|nr:ABC transporter ATP-binding protein [Halioglobus sp.]
MTEPAIRARNLTRRFGEVVAVDAIDLEIPAGRIYGFLGPNGCGKTTTIRMLCGLLTPSSGDAAVLGLQLPGQAEKLRHRIGYMTQKFSLYEDLSVEENMRFISRVYGLGAATADRRIDQLLERYSLGNLRGRRAAQMSGGQRQRLALATATLHEPDLLFLDEPTSAVDPENRRDFWEKLFDLVDAGTTILVSTHYMDEAERCHELAILETGHLRRQGSPAGLMAELEDRVIEVHGDGLREVKEQAMTLPEVRSAAQQGLHLRILLNERLEDPLSYLQTRLRGEGLTLQMARASLEDVFVASTRGGDKP